MWRLSPQILPLALSLIANAHAQEVAEVTQLLSLFHADKRIAATALPKAYAMGGAIDEWLALAPAAPLSASGNPADKRGVLWIAQSEAGIVVAGYVAPKTQPPEKLHTAPTNKQSFELALASVQGIDAAADLLGLLYT